MPRLSEDRKLSVRNEATRFLAQSGFASPPLLPDEALAARQIEVTQLSLDDLLDHPKLQDTDVTRVHAMLEVPERLVTFRSDLGLQRRNWGSLHEIAHEFLPWQRDVLYACPLLMLPEHLQKDFEAEADVFASEAFFFGDRFAKDAKQGNMSLATAIELADSVYQTSYHATFRRYIEGLDEECALIVWKPVTNGTPPDAAPEQMRIQYYVRSRGFRGHIDVGQTADPDHAVSKLFNTPSFDGFVEHEMVFQPRSGEPFIARAESFSNSYEVFTFVKSFTPIHIQAGS
jgi:hypothetical protein